MGFNVISVMQLMILSIGVCLVRLIEFPTGNAGTPCWCLVQIQVSASGPRKALGADQSTWTSAPTMGDLAFAWPISVT